MPVAVSIDAAAPPLPRGCIAGVRRAVSEVLDAHGWTGAAVSVHIGDDRLLRRLNRRYRGRDRRTDVLSFRMLEDDAGPPGLRVRRPPLLGDVVISADRAVAQARRFGHSVLRECCYLAAHGTLHLLGYDDAEPEDARRMADVAGRILDGLGIGR